MDLMMQHISKSFSGVPVLKDISIHVREKEIHALVGENGAGKSTLMKILTGVHQKDSGSITINGNEVMMKNIKDSEQAKIAIIHQELHVLPSMTIEENLFLGREIIYPWKFLNKKEMTLIAQDTLNSLGLNISPHTLIQDLSVGQRQLCEIARALLMNAELIIMDEPTAALSEKETDLLFGIIRALRKKNVSFIYISHRMEEIFELCDTITVLRDGEWVATKNAGDTHFTEIIKLMVGYDLDDRFPRINCTMGKTILEVKNLSKKNQYEDISFCVHKNEIVCFAGLMGAGRTEVMHSLFGSTQADTGTIFINNHKVKINSPGAAKKLGIGFVTEDRKNEGLILHAQTDDNMILASLPFFQKKFLINKKKIAAIVHDYIAKLQIRAKHKSIQVNTLSGGNQQKVVIAKWLMTQPKILILDEPTRGVDVGAKREIYKIINVLKESGVAVIIVSSDLPEVLGIADRIIVMHNKKITAIIDRENATQEKIMHYAMGKGEICE